DLRPVRSRDSGQMRRIGARGPVDLAEEIGRGDAFVLSAQAVDEDRELLAHRRRGGRLTVCVGEHRNLGQRRGGFGQGVDERLRPRQPYLLSGYLDSELPGNVVDVLSRAAAVHEITPLEGHALA